MVCLCSCMKNSVFYPSSSILRRPPPRVCFLFLLYPGPSSLSEYFHICLQKFFAMIDLEILKKQGRKPVRHALDMLNDKGWNRS